MRFPFDTTIERDGEEIEVRVIYDISPIIPARGPTYSCGGQPAEGGEIELISVTCDGKPFATTEAEDDALVAECIERSARDMDDEAAAHADWKYQEYRDRQLMEKWERDQ